MGNSQASPAPRFGNATHFAIAVAPAITPILSATVTPIFSFVLSCMSLRIRHGSAASTKSIMAFHAPRPIQILVPTRGAQHSPPTMLGSHVLDSGVHCAQGMIALTMVVTLMEMMQNQTKALVRPEVRRRSVMPKEVFVQPVTVMVMLARTEMMMM